MIERRQFLLGAGSAALAAKAAPQRRPNGLMIGVDDMNDWVGCLGGYPGVRTPNIDRCRKWRVVHECGGASPYSPQGEVDLPLAQYASQPTVSVEVDL